MASTPAEMAPKERKTLTPAETTRNERKPLLANILDSPYDGAWKLDKRKDDYKDEKEPRITSRLLDPKTRKIVDKSTAPQPGRRRVEFFEKSSDRVEVVMFCCMGIGTTNYDKRIQGLYDYFKEYDKSLADKIHFVLVNYPGKGGTDWRPSPWNPLWPYVRTDHEAVVKFLREEYRKKGKRDVKFAVFGLSIGGALALSIANTDPHDVPFDFVIRICGPSTFSDARNKQITLLTRAVTWSPLGFWFLAKDFRIGNDWWKLKSRMREYDRAGKQYPALDLVHYKHDATVLVKSSRDLWNQICRRQDGYKERCTFSEFTNERPLHGKGDLHAATRWDLWRPICELVDARVNGRNHKSLGQHVQCESIQKDKYPKEVEE